MVKAGVSWGSACRPQQLSGGTPDGPSNVSRRQILSYTVLPMGPSGQGGRYEGDGHDGGTGWTSGVVDIVPPLPPQRLPGTPATLTHVGPPVHPWHSESD